MLGVHAQRHRQPSLGPTLQGRRYHAARDARRPTHPPARPGHESAALSGQDQAGGAIRLGLFKGGLLWRQAHWGTVLRFGLPAIPASIAGAWLLDESLQLRGYFGCALMLSGMLVAQLWPQKPQASAATTQRA